MANSAFSKAQVTIPLTVDKGGTNATSASAARTNLGLVIGTDVQAYDAQLDTWSTVTPSANGQSLVSAANYAAMRTLLDLEAGTDFYTIAATDSAIDADVSTHAALTATHGVAGAIVGTTDTQTLSAKDLTATTNKLRFQKAITVESPTATEDISFFFTNNAITITEMRAVLVGSSTPSVTWTLRHGTDRSAAGAEVVTSGTTTTSTTTGSDVTSFNDATIVADSFVWLETSAQSGTVGSLEVTVFYTED